MNTLLVSSILLFCNCLMLQTTRAITFDEDVTLTGTQKLTLDKFKEIMAGRLPHDYMNEDLYLLKWLQARDFNVWEAETMLLKNLQWREEQHMDTIHEENWSEYFRDFQYHLDGKDKQGRPILYLDIGSHDLRKVVLAGSTAKYLRFVDKCIDETCNLVRETGRKYGNITRGNVIYDLDGFNLAQHACLQCLPVILRIFDSYLNHYPRCADQIIFVNTPGVFEVVLNALKNVADPETKRLLKVYGKNRKMYQEAMAKDFDFTQLPPSLGGTKIYNGTEDNFY